MQHVPPKFSMFSQMQHVPPKCCIFLQNSACSSQMQRVPPRCNMFLQNSACSTEMEHVPAKRWYPAIRLQGITTQKIWMWARNCCHLHFFRSLARIVYMIIVSCKWHFKI
jgi:hypothetical protein